MPDYFVHESSYIDEGAQIGAGTKIWHFSHVMTGARIGERCNIGQNVLVSPEVTIGNNVKIQNNVSLYTGVTVEEDAFLGPSMVFTNVINPRSHVNRKDEFKATRVRKGASIGANATIVCGTTLGRYCFVGAGAVVTHDVPDYALVYGSPARVRGWMCQCGEPLTFTEQKGMERAVCASCGDSYQKQGQVVTPEGGVQ
jgi:UDP-2-acetamido-3-amino-2,3-dideoxy-glucuronate N-acetyltransferase